MRTRSLKPGKKKQPGDIFKESTYLKLLILYFFTGFLANYETLVSINNLILVVFVGYVLLTKKRESSLLSPLLFLYGTLTALSLINHLRWLSEAGLPLASRTMPITFCVMLACRLCAVPGLFEKAIIVNSLPFVILIPFGAQFEGGHFSSQFLSETILGGVLPFAFAVGLNAIWDLRFNWRYIAALVSSLSFMLLSASRRMYIYLMLSVFTVIFKRDNQRITPTIRLAAALTVICILLYAVPIMREKQIDRFGDDFTWQGQIEDILSGNSSERSAEVRAGFINLAVDTMNENWMGFGNANFPFVVSKFAGLELPEASNPHSGFAESLVTAGYPGAILYILMLLYLAKIGYNDRLMRLCIIWIFMVTFVDSTLSDRILWPLLAIAERELQINSRLSSRDT